MSETDDIGMPLIPDETAAGAPGDASRAETVMFLESSRPSVPLAETTDYRPGAAVAFLFLGLPAASALAIAALAPLGEAPLWLPLSLLLWIPLLLAGWWALGGVRLTRESIAFGQPLRAWRVIPLDAIERLQWRGPILTVVTRTGQRQSFMPAILTRGAQLRRRLLLTLPTSALDSGARAEAQLLLEGSVGIEDDAVEALILRTPRWQARLAAAVALAAILSIAAVIIWAPNAWTGWEGRSLMAALALIAALALGACGWLAQDIFITEHSVIVRFPLTGWMGTVAWVELRSIRRTPGELALILHGRRQIVCAGPGLLAPHAARQMREAVSHFVQASGTPVLPPARS
ncbi:MAG TPA: hypothetical protein VF808_01440 [Ktedonobacterales bacterium]